MSADHRRGAIDFDAELRRHHEVLIRACDVRPGEHVLDIGCGTGLTTRQAARAAETGRALGVDVSASAIARARELAHAAGPDNVAFECVDAQVHRFPRGRFDVAISRFGTMFFDDFVTAFTNIRRALRPDGRLVMMVWQAHDRNEWSVVVDGSLGGSEPPAAHGPVTSDPFSLADPPTVVEILGSSGFDEVAVTEVHEPVFYGRDVDTALDWVRSFTCTRRVLDARDPADAERVVGRLRGALAAHLAADGVWFDSRGVDRDRALPLSREQPAANTDSCQGSGRRP